MNRSGSSKKRGMGILAVSAFLILLFLLSTGNRGFIRQFRAWHNRTKLRKEIEILRGVCMDLEEEKKKLEDPEVIERIAREKFGMARKNEKVYRVVPEDDK
ncbi:septum formation initiator family protein [bacterium]|nr:septum formation initiator family protein [bacterium]